ncbi:MAG: PspC domain-containing protein [Ignavibacteriaceae bacterium]|jgi:phage shock protein C
MNNKRLYRSRKDKMLGGVAGGIAEYFEIDPVIFRIIFAVTFFVFGGGLLAYIIMWIIIPQEPFFIANDNLNEGPKATGPDPQVERKSNINQTGSTGGTVLIIIGVLFLLHNFFPIFHFRHYWPLIIIAIGAGLLMRSRNN